jgi:hypothetical protein
MYHPFNHKVIVFPHLVYGNQIDGVTYDWNCCNGAKSIGSFGLTSNQFFGGRSVMLGFIKELGIWGCQDKHHMESLIGFYLYDPEEVTAKGKKLIEKMIPNYTVQFVKYEDVKLSDEETKELLERFRSVKQEAKDLGYSVQVIEHADVNTLEGLIKAKRFEAQRAGQLEKELRQEKEQVKTATPKPKPVVAKKPVPNIKIAQTG